MTTRQKFGQNFLIDQNMIKKMISLADLNENDTVYELGTGHAVLTALLCQKSKYVVSSEIDKNLYESAKIKLSKNQNLELMHIDGLKYTDNFSIFISSLPFSESERFIRWLAERDFRRAVVILQKEFVDKLTSKSNTPYYRAISVISQYCFNIEEIEILSPNCFIPKPKVYSKIVVFTPKNQLNSLEMQSIKKLFSYRRKKLGTAIKMMTSNQFYSQNSSKYNIDLSHRLDDLSPEDIVLIIKKFIINQD